MVMATAVVVEIATTEDKHEVTCGVLRIGLGFDQRPRNLVLCLAIQRSVELRSEGDGGSHFLVHDQLHERQSLQWVCLAHSQNILYVRIRP